MPNKEVMLTLQDIADILQCSKKTVDRMVAAGDLPPPASLGTGRRLRRWHPLAVWQRLNEGANVEGGGVTHDRHLLLHIPGLLQTPQSMQTRQGEES